jgi:hypothetical protein
VKLSEKDLEIISRTALEFLEKQRETEEKKGRDKRLRNTKLLLRNYREFKAYAARIESKKLQTEDIENIDIKELLVFGEDIVKSIKQTTQRTLVMVRHLDQALSVLKTVNEQEKSSGASKQYDILHERFVMGITIAELADVYGINERSVYKAIDAAAERLTIILFGVYGLKIE